MADVYDDRYNASVRYIKRRVSEVEPILSAEDDPSEQKPAIKLKPTLVTSVVAGGLAGMIVDFSLYPLDTIKTRLQSKNGFRASGGFSGIYKGIVPVLLGSAPISALFFATYNTLINTLRTEDSSLNPVVYLAAASIAEVLCASVRVPIEIVKQRKQTSSTSSIKIIGTALKAEGFLGLYRGFTSTLLREIPFAAIQYPLWELMLHQMIIYYNGQELNALQTACCGATAGAIAAAITTPMDVVKTRIMLAEKEKIEQYKPYLNFRFGKEVFFERGITGFFAGIIPRVTWITLGGFIYFGAYEKGKIICEEQWCAYKKRLQQNRQKKYEDRAASYEDDKVDTFSIFSEPKCPTEENAGGDDSPTEERKLLDANVGDAVIDS